MKRFIALACSALCVVGCSSTEPETEGVSGLEVDRFADVRVLRYDVPGFEELDLEKKKLAYFLYRAALAGRDIFWDQNHSSNLRIRRTFEEIVKHYTGDREAEPFLRFMVLLRRVWFASGIHHHYSGAKFKPDFRFGDLVRFARNSPGADFPLREGQTQSELLEELRPVLFDASVAPKKVNRETGVDKVATSAVNFYEDVSEAEVTAFYDGRANSADPRPISHGLNSKLVKEEGHLREKVWMIDGMYGDAIERIVYWLERAIGVAENERQSRALELLVQYYRTGDLRTFDQYNIAWIRDTDSDIDVINGFIEVYNDPLGFRGSFESVVSFRNPTATRRIASIAREAQWFEDHSPIQDAHKRTSVRGIVGKAITVIVESGDASPSSPIGINLPNANWIRANFGSKSVNLSNIVDAYDAARGPAVEEFAGSKEEIALEEQYGRLAGNLLTDMHEVIGHASGRINPGVGTPKETLAQYASTMEEARADLVGLYYILDPKLIEIGVMPNLDVGRTQYNRYVRNALLQQLQRIEPGEQLEQSHMRNRQMVASWAFERGRAEQVIARETRNGKTYFAIRDYASLRELFGELLREIQRIKSEGDLEAAHDLVETWGVAVDTQLHAEVLARYEALDVAPYTGFLNPRLVSVEKDGEIVDVAVEYLDSFVDQMLEYAADHSFLPTQN